MNSVRNGVSIKSRLFLGLRSKSILKLRRFFELVCGLCWKNPAKSMIGQKGGNDNGLSMNKL